ncbi:MAG: hypothetical protein ACI4XL_02310 [Bacillus sp. (in: firmicutes)]
MKKGYVLSIVGLLLFMAGIYLATHWIIIGTAIGIFGGFLMGSSSYFLTKDK